MASKNKSEKLSLNLWAETDRPQRADFNSDNMIVDEVLGSHIADENLHLTSAEKSRVGAPISTAAYLGDGAASREINLPVSALAAIVYCDGMPAALYDSATGCVRNYMGVCVYGAGGSNGLTLRGNTLLVTQSAAQNGSAVCFNESGKQYRVAAIV